MFKRFLCCLLATSLITGTSAIASAQDSTLETVSEYQETYLYIDFSNVNIASTDDGWNLAPAQSLSRAKSAMVETDIQKLQSLMEEFPDLEENLFTVTNGEELVAASFTEVPLILVGNHYERIPVDTGISTCGSAESDPNGRGKFLLYTTILGGKTAESGGYRYSVWTTGSWSENSILGNTDYPDSGDDFVFQTCPSTFSRLSDAMAATYNYSPTVGVSGTDFWRENGDSTYVRYGIVDDPLGNRQNVSFSLLTSAVGPQSSEIRQIGSYYVHTWSQMSVSASVSFSSTKSVTLSLTPSMEEDSWQVYNYVPFTF